MKDKTLEAAVAAVEESVEKSASLFTAKRLIFAGVVALAVASTVFVVSKVRKAKDSGEDTTTED